MDKIFFKYILLFFIFLFISAAKYDDSVLLWQENKPLTWADFKGKPEKRFAAASTHYDIFKTLSVQNQKKANVKIEAVFFRNKSWKNKNWINESVLRHEQKHFDIVELFARKLRKSISACTFKNNSDLNTKTDSLYKMYDKEMDVYQDKYDDETDGSMNGEKQREWEKIIMLEITNLNEFKNTTFSVAFN
jgi:hypothetical protein